MTELMLTESASSAAALAGTRWKAKLIAADTWGSTAYYPADVLERDGARVFQAGTQIFQDHQTETEKWDRPEGSVANLVGRLDTEAVYEGDNPEGPGLYAEVSFYESYVTRIKEIGKDIGLSIRASGLTEDGEAAGRYGPILQGFLSVKSVDVVTKAGAGGKLTSIIESDRSPAGRLIEESEKGTQSMTDVTKEDFDQLKTELVEAIAGIPAALAEALKPEPAGVEVVADVVVKEPVDEVVVDNDAVLVAVAESHLPSAVIPNITADVKAGKSLEEAVKVQTDYRDSLVESAQGNSGVVVINESTKVSGLARSVEVLGR